MSSARQLVEYHPIFGHRFIPSLKTRVPHEGGGYLFQSNSAGFRSHHEFTPEKTLGTTRVLLFGDSFTAGDGVSNRDRYSDRLEARTPDLEVYNFGLSGSGTDQQYLIWKDTARTIAADVVVIAIQPENIRRNAAEFREGVSASGERMLFAKPYFVLEGGALTLRNQPVPREPVAEGAAGGDARVDRGGRFAGLRKFVTTLGLKDLVQRAARPQPLPEYDDPENPDWLLTRAILTEWVRAVEQPVILFSVPLYHYVEDLADATSYRQRYAALARELGCAFVDPLDAISKHSREERRSFRFETDVHPTPRYHTLLAEVLSAAIAPPIRGANE